MRAVVLQSVDMALEDQGAMRRPYAADVTLPTTEFRVLMTGIDADGIPFQRVTQQLFIAEQ